MALEMGFKNVASGPMVRSSYHADQQAAESLALVNSNDKRY
jgi:lipoic acid synthetase